MARSAFNRWVAIVSMSTVVSTWVPAAAADPLFVGWSELVPPLTYQYDPSSSDDCRAGRVKCVESTIREMQGRFEPLADSCSHQAVFALAYLRTTESYLRYNTTPGFFDDPAFVNHEDVVFAKLYFNAFDDWRAGGRDRVPEAWRIALDAAQNHRVNGLGNLLLGMNAHVNRDLPFVLAGIGLTTPAGESRKPDHDRVNKVLNSVVEPLVAEEASRFDPQIPVITTPYGVGYTGLMQALVLWRESAWRFAELLVSAPTPAARELVAAQIELNAAVTARSLVGVTGFLPPLTSTGTRDDFCAAR